MLCGVQGSGKTTLYRDRFLATHVRVSMDLLRTRAREALSVSWSGDHSDLLAPLIVDASHHQTEPT